jgi:hypothetical protein
MVERQRVVRTPPHPDGADWRDVARIVLHLDPEHESDRARRAFDSHLSRAKWMTEHGKRKRRSPFATSGLPPRADIMRTGRHFRFVPQGDVAASFDPLVGKRIAATSLLPDASLPQPIDKVVELPTKLRIT